MENYSTRPIIKYKYLFVKELVVLVEVGMKKDIAWIKCKDKYTREWIHSFCFISIDKTQLSIDQKLNHIIDIVEHLSRINYLFDVIITKLLLSSDENVVFYSLCNIPN